MRLLSFNARNFRTLESLDLKFNRHYTALCGANDSGKTNVVRAVRSLLREDSPLRFFEDEGSRGPSMKKDLCKFAEESNASLSLSVQLELNRQLDTGVFEAVVKQLSIDAPPDTLDLHLSVTHPPGALSPDVRVEACGQSYDGISAQEVLKRFQTGRSILFHNSTKDVSQPDFRSMGTAAYVRPASSDERELVEHMNKTVHDGLNKLSQGHQRELQALLGRLSNQYQVGMSVPDIDLSDIPCQLTLGHSAVTVPLAEWGSGTVNRTMIFMTMFRARQVLSRGPSADKVTPVIVIEEPESFLHPSAQAEFGRVLQALAREFDLQLIVTTHSPYLLNLQDPSANVLLSRNTRDGQLRDTIQVDTTGENWTEPFGVALGLRSEEFRPWRETLFSDRDSLLLCEGPIDKEYLEMLRRPEHGENRLRFEGDILPYDGVGNVQHAVLLGFIKNRCRRLIVTYDLDMDQPLDKLLKSLKMIKERDYFPIGLESAGKRNIEGLLPESILTDVYSANPSLVQQATSGNQEERKAAMRQLKAAQLSRFKDVATPRGPHYSGLYSLAERINKALPTQKGIEKGA